MHTIAERRNCKEIRRNCEESYLGNFSMVSKVQIDLGLPIVFYNFCI